MVATRGRTFKRPWRRSCLSSKLKSSSAPIGRKDSWCFHAVGSSNAPLLGSTAAEGLPRIGRTSIATRWRSCGLPQSASCSENFVIPPDVFGQTLRLGWTTRAAMEHQRVAFHAAMERPRRTNVWRRLTSPSHPSLQFETATSHFGRKNSLAFLRQVNHYQSRQREAKGLLVKFEQTRWSHHRP